MNPGDKAIVNGRGDLSMIEEARPFIGQSVEIVKVTKSGLYQVRLPDGRLYTLPQQNLESG